MIREFFGKDVPEALEKASKKLSIPIEFLSYKMLEGSFGGHEKEQKLGILVEYDPTKSQPDHKEKTETPKDYVDPRSITDLVERAKFYLNEILCKMGFQAKTEAQKTDSAVVLSVTLGNGKLDQRRGESREIRSALQLLINRMAQGGPGDDLKFVVDIGGKMQERSTQLQAMAKDIEQKVMQIKKPLNIITMDSQDRRVIHQALMDNDKVSTSSMGNSRFRVLCIEPKPDGNKPNSLT